MSEPTPQDQVAQTITGYWLSQAVYVAARLRIADRLTDGPQPVEMLAEATGTHPRTLYRLLRALASVGIFSEDDAGRFRLTPTAEVLRGDVPDSMWAMAIMMGEEHFHAWGGLLESVRTGKTAFDRLYGKPIFAYLAEHPEKAKVFDAAMTAIHGRETAAVLDAYDFSGIGVLADIGGGNGSNLIGILGRYPGMRGILFDLPHVVERARHDLEAAGTRRPLRRDRRQLLQADPRGGRRLFPAAHHPRLGRRGRRPDPAARPPRHARRREAAGGRACPAARRRAVVRQIAGPEHARHAGRRRADRGRVPAALRGAGFRLARVVPAQGDLSVIEGLPA